MKHATSVFMRAASAQEVLGAIIVERADFLGDVFGTSSVIGSSPGIAVARMRVRTGPGLKMFTPSLSSPFCRAGARHQF